MSEKRRSFSTWLGCGCAAVIGLFMGGVLLVTLLSYRAGKSMQGQARDPAAAAAAVREILPYEELPPGYRPVGGMSVPLLLDMAFVAGKPAGGGPQGEPRESDAAGGGAARTPGEPQEGGAPAAAAASAAAAADFDRGFLYLRFRDLFGRGERTRAWLGNEGADDQPLEQQEIRFTPRETVARGEIAPAELAAAAPGTDARWPAVTWVARRGRVKIDLSRFGAEAEGGEAEDGATAVPDHRPPGAADDRPTDRAPAAEDGEGAGPATDDPQAGGESVLTLLDLDCGDRYQHVAVWYTPDPAPQVPAAELEWRGTPADPAAIRAFLVHFRPCR